MTEASQCGAPPPQPLVPGRTREAQAIGLAGALAELGIPWIDWRDPDDANPPSPTRRLAARHADLVGLLCHAAPGPRLACLDGRLTIHVTPRGLAWSAQTEDLAHRLGAALSP